MLHIIIVAETLEIKTLIQTIQLDHQTLLLFTLGTVI